MDSGYKRKAELESFEAAYQLQIEEALEATRQTAARKVEVVVIDDDEAEQQTKRPKKNARPSSTSTYRVATAKSGRKRREAIEVESDDEMPDHKVQAFESCGICMDQVGSKQVHVISGCRHRFCCACLNTYVTQQVKAKIFPVPCPSPKCKGAISVSECAELLTSQEAMNTLKILEVESCIPEDEKIFCPHASCSALMTRPRALGEKEGGKAECLECHRMVCMRCKTAWHTGMSCKQFQKLPMDARSSEDQQLMLLADKKQWKQCGRCHQMIARNKGCNHMTCVCKHEFCYICGKEWARCGSYGCNGASAAEAQGSRSFLARRRSGPDEQEALRHLRQGCVVS